MNMMEWVICPICNNKTRIKIRKDTQLKNFPLYCPKCKKESLICVNNFKIEIIKEPSYIAYRLSAHFNFNLILAGNRSYLSSISLYLTIPSATLSMITRSASVKLSILLSSCLRLLLFTGLSEDKKNSSTDTFSRDTRSYSTCKLGCCPLFSILVK